MEKFEEIELELIRFEATDILTNSTGGESGEGNTEEPEPED